VEQFLISVKPDLHFAKKYCIFVVQKWGIAKTLAIPLYFAPFFSKKSQDFVKISRQ
jgi:hypothetical protein